MASVISLMHSFAFLEGSAAAGSMPGTLDAWLSALVVVSLDCEPVRHDGAAASAWR